MRTIQAAADRYDAVKQYSLRQILAVWAAAAIPMGVLACVVAPWLSPEHVVMSEVGHLARREPRAVLAQDVVDRLDADAPLQLLWGAGEAVLVDLSGTVRQRDRDGDLLSGTGRAVRRGQHERHRVVLVRDPGEQVRRVRGGLGDQQSRIRSDGAGQRSLISLGLVAPVEQVALQLRVSLEHPPVEDRGDVPDGTPDNGLGRANHFCRPG